MHNSQIGVVHFAWGWLLMRQLPFSQASGTCGSTGCHAHGGLRADVGIGPYEKADGMSVGADFISARTAPLCRMYLRRTYKS